ncbi:hypothetical protein V6N13_115994 [Hibiscus sabdariffa]
MVWSMLVNAGQTSSQSLSDLVRRSAWELQCTLGAGSGAGRCMGAVCTRGRLSSLGKCNCTQGAGFGVVRCTARLVHLSRLNHAHPHRWRMGVHGAWVVLQWPDSGGRRPN